MFNLIIVVIDIIEWGLVDGIIFFGWVIGSFFNLEDLELVINVVKGILVFIGSGVDEDNIG